MNIFFEPPAGEVAGLLSDHLHCRWPLENAGPRRFANYEGWALTFSPKKGFLNRGSTHRTFTMKFKGKVHSAAMLLLISPIT